MKKYYIGHYLSGLKDGGQARNKAFQEYFEKKNAIILDVFNKNIFFRFLSFIQCLKIFIFSKSDKVFLHQGSFLVLFPLAVLKVPFFFRNIFMLLARAAKRNDLTIEVNDLIYEQAIDLNLPVNDLYLSIENKLYSIPCRYIFASHEMATYVSRKYNIPNTNYEVIINGANELKDLSQMQQLPSCLLSPGVKYVYAGSLNKGRQIEDLILLFSDRKELLILLGEWGDWLKDVPTTHNIHYIGKHDEDYAQFLVSKCDVGLIPYDESKFYYNLCYPTKASFYISAGIPFLSTPLKELINVFKDLQMAYFIPFSKWAEFINANDQISLQEIKYVVNKNKSKFYWDTIIKL